MLLLLFWALAFLTLCASVLALTVFYGVIQSDLELHSLPKEAGIAGLASLVEALGVWLVVLFIPASHRGTGLYGMLIPALIVAIIYKATHVEDWNRYHLLLLLILQIVICGCAASLILRRF